MSALERGSSAASMAMLEKLSTVLEVSVSELLATNGLDPSAKLSASQVLILNNPTSVHLAAPSQGSKRSRKAYDGLSLPALRAGDSFALYLPDDSMAPEFGKGDLVTFSLSRKPADGDACLVDTGKGQVLFRTVLAMGKGRWRLQANNPRYEPVMVSAGKRLKMWPAVGYWRMLGSTRRR